MKRVLLRLMAYRARMPETPSEQGVTWASYLREMRETRGLTIDELAERASVSRMTIIRWESGQGGFKHETLAQVARALRIPLQTALNLTMGAELAEPQLPREMTRLVELYSRMHLADQADLLARVDWINEWAEARIASTDTLAKRRRRRAG